jgi:regulatory protein
VTATADADPEVAARAICLRLLAAAPRTRAELAAALGKRGVPDEPAGRALDRLAAAGLVDDAALAASFAASRQRDRGLAPPAIARELRRRGVAAETVADTLAGLDPAAEEEAARRLAARRAAGLAGLPRPVAMRRLAGVLARRGYRPALALRVAGEALGPFPDDAEGA